MSYFRIIAALVFIASTNSFAMTPSCGEMLAGTFSKIEESTQGPLKIKKYFDSDGKWIATETYNGGSLVQLRKPLNEKPDFYQGNTANPIVTYYFSYDSENRLTKEVMMDTGGFEFNGTYKYTADNKIESKTYYYPLLNFYPSIMAFGKIEYASGKPHRETRTVPTGTHGSAKVSEWTFDSEGTRMLKSETNVEGDKHF